jgi:hypothetical protein
MSFWTGTNWEQADAAPPSVARATRRRHVLEALAEGTLVALLVAGLIGGTTFAAKGGNGGSPTLYVSMAAAAKTSTSSPGSLTVGGTGFIPSSGGQQVILWVGYPDDYCSPDYSVCHGFYAYPTVKDDGSFDVTYQDVLMQSGTGVVKAFQYSAQTDKWRTVDKVTYTAP